MKNGIIVGMGEVLWDNLPGKGKTPGGAPANFAYHISQFGLESRIVSAVGEDESGEELLQALRDKQIETLICKVAYPTGQVDVELDREGVPGYRIREDVAWDNIPFTPRLESLAHMTRAVCFGSLAQRNAVSRRTIARFLDAMPDDADHYRIFDINLRQSFYGKEVLCESFRRCNILKINDEELSIVDRMFNLQGSGAQEKCRMLMREYDLKTVLLTCGDKGSYLFTPSSLSYIDTPKVKAIDTVGAGDSFTAAFIAALLNGKSVGEAHRLAVDVSAYVCTQNGATPLLPESLIRRAR